MKRSRFVDDEAEDESELDEDESDDNESGNNSFIDSDSEEDVNNNMIMNAKLRKKQEELEELEEKRLIIKKTNEKKRSNKKKSNEKHSNDICSYIEAQGRILEQFSHFSKQLNSSSFVAILPESSKLNINQQKCILFSTTSSKLFDKRQISRPIFKLSNDTFKKTSKVDFRTEVTTEITAEVTTATDEKEKKSKISLPGYSNNIFIENAEVSSKYGIGIITFIYPGQDKAKIKTDKGITTAYFDELKLVAPDAKEEYINHIKGSRHAQHDGNVVKIREIDEDEHIQKNAVVECLKTGKIYTVASTDLQPVE